MPSLFTAKKISAPVPEFKHKELSGPCPDSDNDEKSPLPVDIYRVHNQLIILAPIAGITIEDVSVFMTDDILTIQGHRAPVKENGNVEHYSEECFWGEFSRSIVIPVPVDTNQVAAFYKKGILRIEMPIVEEERTRVIPVKINNYQS